MEIIKFNDFMDGSWREKRAERIKKEMIDDVQRYATYAYIGMLGYLILDFGFYGDNSVMIQMTNDVVDVLKEVGQVDTPLMPLYE